MSAEELRQIVKRLEGGEVGPRVDADVHAALFGGWAAYRQGSPFASYGDDRVFSSLNVPILTKSVRRAAPVSQSIDAAVAFHNNVLPGWGWRVATCCVSDDAWTFPDFNDPQHGERLLRQFPAKETQQDPVGFFGTDVDLRPPGRHAAALLIATLKALISTSKEGA